MANPIETASYNKLRSRAPFNYFSPIPLAAGGKVAILHQWEDPELQRLYPFGQHVSKKGNLGAVIGPDYLVLDIDPRNGGAESFQQFKQDFPTFAMFYTASVLTAGGGAHFYLTLPQDHGRRITKSLPQYPGLDWLSGNRYVVAPGSVNGAGSWSWFNEPVTEPPLITQDILDALFPAVDEPQGGELPEADGLWGLLTPEDLARLLALLDVTHYAEHDKWFELMATCHHATAGDGKEVFLEWSASDPLYSGDYELSAYRWDTLSNEGPGSRPLTARSLTRCFDAPPAWLLAKLNHTDTSTLFSPIEAQAPVVDQVKEAEEALAEYHGKIHMESNPRELTKNLWPLIVQDSRLDEIDADELGKEIAKKAGTTLTKLNRVGRAKAATPPGDSGPKDPDQINEDELHLSVVKGVIKHMGGEQNLVFQAGDFWRYNGKHWSMVDDSQTKYIINKVAREMGGAGFLTGPFIASVNSVLNTYLEPKKEGYWNPADKAVRVNTEGGMLELTPEGMWQILPHERKHKMNYVLPITPQEMATPVFDKYLAEALDNDEGTIRTLLAAMIYTATSKKQWWKKCFFLHGESNTGKTVFLDLVENFIGDDRRDSIAIKDLGRQYVLGGLRGKLLNSSGELDSSRVDVEVFKKLISGDSITVDRKFKSAVKFKNNAIFWFAGNNWPNLRDESNASLNRITLIEFPNIKPAAEQDTALGEKLEAELPGIFYRALQVFAEEYTKDKGLSIRETPEASMRAFNEFRSRSQPILLWVEDRVEVTEDDEDFVTSTTLYQDYRTWATNTGHKILNESSFKTRSPKALGRKSTREAGRHGRRGYAGVRLRSVFE